MLQISGSRIAVDFDPRIMSLFPAAREITFQGNKLAALDHDFHSTLFLRQLGHDVPAPVITQYDWCGGTPFDVQIKTVAMMTTARRCYVLNGLGTGKTRCTLWAFDYLKKCGLANKLLVVAPLSTLRFVWEREIFEAFEHLKVSVLFGTKAKRLQRLAEDADIYLINHDGLNTLLSELTARPGIDCLAIDELAVYRNGHATRTKIMRDFAQSKNWVWGLTGSPIPRSVTDVWGQAGIITPHTVPKYFNQVRQMLCYKATAFKWEPKDDAVELAFSMLQPSARYSLEDVIELPPVVMQYVEVPMGPKQRTLYQAMKTNAEAMVGADKIDALNAGAVLSKLLQIACGWVYTREGKTVTLDNEDRIQTIIEYVEATDRKALVFLPFKSALDGVSQAFDKVGIEHAVVSGDTPAGKRSAIFADFQTTGRYKALVAHPGCLAHGLTLTAADVIIWGGPVTSLETFMQANGRITRIGQKHKQLLVMLGGTPVERKLYTALGKKEITQNYLLDLLAEASK